MPLFAFDLLPGVVAMGIDTPALFSAFHALAVDHAGGWAGLPAHLLSTLHIERVMDPPQCAVVLPTLEIIVQCAPGQYIFRNISPLGARAQHIHDTVQYLPKIDLTWASAVFRGRNGSLDTGPLVVRQVAGVAKLVPVVPGAVFWSPHAAPRESVPAIESDDPGRCKSPPVTDSKDSKTSRTDTQMTPARG